VKPTPQMCPDCRPNPGIDGGFGKQRPLRSRFLLVAAGLFLLDIFMRRVRLGRRGWKTERLRG